MAEIVNLKRVRKDKARREHERDAEANRLRFGRTKAQKAADKDAKERERRAMDERKLESTRRPEPQELRRAPMRDRCNCCRTLCARTTGTAETTNAGSAASASAGRRNRGSPARRQAPPPRVRW